MLYRDSDDAVYSYGSNEVEAMEQYHFFYNAKSTERAAINKFWSLSREGRVDVLYEYFNENIDYWQKELEKEKDV